MKDDTVGFTNLSRVSNFLTFSRFLLCSAPWHTCSGLNVIPAHPWFLWNKYDLPCLCPPFFRDVAGCHKVKGWDQREVARENKYCQLHSLSCYSGPCDSEEKGCKDLEVLPPLNGLSKWGWLPPEGRKSFSVEIYDQSPVQPVGKLLKDWVRILLFPFDKQNSEIQIYRISS